MKKQLTIALLAVALTIGLATTATAQDIKEQTSDVNVTVSPTTQLDVRPSFLDYTGVSPGELVKSSDNSQSYEHVELENIGSTRISDITAQATMPLDQPFGTTDDVLYDTGNFIQLGLSTAEGLSSVTDQIAGPVNQNDDFNGQPPHYVNRVEFFEDQYPEYINPSVPDSGDFRIGRIREGDVEYFVQVNYDSSANEPTTQEVLIGQAPHTATQLGTTDFTGSDVITINETTSDGDAYDYIDTSLELVSFNTSSQATNYSGENLIEPQNDPATGTESVDLSNVELDGSKVTSYAFFVHPEALNSDQPHMVRTRFNDEVDSPAQQDSESGATTSSDVIGQVDIFSATDATNQLQPGQHFPVNIGVELPQGVDRDAIENGAVTFYATQGDSLPN